MPCIHPLQQRNVEAPRLIARPPLRHILCTGLQVGEFILTHPDIRIPERGQIYSFNEANRWNWDKPLQEYVTAIQLVS